MNELMEQMIVLLLFILMALFLCYVLKVSKYIKRDTNRNFLTRLLYAIDLLILLLLTIMIFIYKQPESILRKILGFCVRTLSLYSAMVFGFLGIDIYIAVKDSLKYPLILPLKDIGYVRARPLSPYP